MNFLEATDAPVMWRWKDTYVPLPVWTIDDLKIVLARLQAEKISHLRQACTEVELSKVELAYVLARARWQRLGPADAAAYFRTVEGVQEALRHALTRAGINPQQIQAMLNATPFSQLAELSRDVLRLESPEAPPVPPATGAGQEHQGDTHNPFAVPPSAI